MQKLIVIEGLDGSGKATQAGLLSDYFRQLGQSVREVSFPNYESDSSALVRMYLGGELGEKPGDVNAYAASSFYAVDRYASFKMDWEKDWKSGIIVADRYTTSNAIHQCSKLDKSEWDAYLHWLFEYEYELLGIPAPTLVLFLHVDPEVSQQLLLKRYEGDAGKKDIHERNAAYLKKCMEAAEYCAEKLGWSVVECSRGGRMRSVEDIQREILDVLSLCR